MAAHGRVLYPFPANSSECLSTCSPDCFFYNLCKLPHPETLPLLSFPPPPSTPIHLHHFPRLLLSLLIPSALLLFLSLLFLFLCLFFGYRRSRSRNLLDPPTPVILPFHHLNLNPPDNHMIQDSDQHYVWYIRTVGLDDSAIHAISASSYKSGSDGMAGCTVCLGEFHDGELLRLLPKCGHAFHVACIDTWLRAHANCPLCRAAVVVPLPPTCAVPILPAPPSHIDDDQSSDTGMLNLGDGNSSTHGNGEFSLCTQPVRRSASMGSLACKRGNFEQGSASNSKELMACFGLEVELVRSWSCRGNRFFLSRHGQG